MRALAITVDVDSPTEYAALHGVALAAEDPHLMYRAPLDRFASLCRAVGGPGTVFAIARDVSGIAAEKLRRLDADGFEIGCHSFAHDYRLTERVDGEVARDLRRAKGIFEQELGILPLGFRAPGHHLSPAIFDELEELGFVYDSSVLPSPVYWAAKAAVLASYRARGRASVSLLGSPRGTLAPRRPYRPGHDPYTRGARRLLELPITVATPLRLPITGAALLLAPALVRRALLYALSREPIVIVNLHAMEQIGRAHV
jgi:peptidoglycan/xylan/chitin deacetylase (PgdA/CDA1 family)